MTETRGLHIHISGIVQGVGFRPFVYGLAARLALTGWVRNTSAGVDIEAHGPPQALERFTRALQEETPSLARIDELRVEACQGGGFTAFEIVHSQAHPDDFQPISPDVSICPDCLRELFDPADRRYRYPFINCTNCGPRFSIIDDIPYDRPKTTMAGFPMCPECHAEYTNPLERRFHAQPIACPVCGPHVWLEGREQPSSSRQALTGEDAIQAAQWLLREGKIVAVKGLGGFHLACDATNPAAVVELRRRKLRVDKPFALMAPDVAAAAEHCFLNQAERELLESRERPIVILGKRPESPIDQVAPRQETLGMMLPYTPLHYLLFSEKPHPPGSLTGHAGRPLILVMTSGNLSEEPIATRNDEARRRLASLADAFLMHDRPIQTRCDDSVMRVTEVCPTPPPLVATEGRVTGGEKLHAPYSPSPNLPHQGGGSKLPLLLPLRRSRGYAPFPVRLPWKAPPLLAVGAELKNTFCITRDRYAFLSHHIGDLENYETLRSFEDGVIHFERLFRVRPQILVYDLHPDYLATRYALERAERERIPVVGVQHHHAHVAACMAENGLAGERAVIGVAFDGTGYGDDGAIWGGEFLVADYTGYRRPYHLAYTPLPGGDAAVRKPGRTALAYLWQAGLEWQPELACVAGLSSQERAVLLAQLERRLNAPLTSSMGRLFDAVSALVGVRQQVNYEAQAAIELEALADPAESALYPFELKPDGSIDPRPLLAAILSDLGSATAIEKIAARFHNGVANMVYNVCSLLRASYGLSEVALSGGVWQNVTLLRKSLQLLEQGGFTVYVHHQVPPNDGGLALGQAAIGLQSPSVRVLCV
ncbi:MAG: carbamoyltransferase HypF [Thermoflexales bacterium]|nr:carbamoyltransferase HypF [Thermoflexales bacterium]